MPEDKKLVEKCLLTPGEIRSVRFQAVCSEGFDCPDFKVNNLIDKASKGLLAKAIPIIQEERDEDWYSILELITEEYEKEITEIEDKANAKWVSVLSKYKVTVDSPESLSVAVDVLIKEAEKRVVEESKRELGDLIIGIDGCKFEERLDDDKGCIVLDMNMNQWQAFWQRYES